MHMTIANLLALAVGFSASFFLLRDVDGAFSPQKADGMRLALAFFLCFFGGWFTQAEPGSDFHSIDVIVMMILTSLALASLRWPPLA